MNDTQIIDGIIGRNEQSLQELMNLYGRYGYAVAFRILKDHQAAEECLSDALHAVWTGIPPRPESLKYYFASFVRHISINRIQKDTAIKRGGGQLHLAYEELSECIPCHQTPEKEFLCKELSSEINRFLETLSQRDRSIFLRRYYFFEDSRSIAKQYGIRSNNVLLILSRTRKKLKTFLETEGFLE